MEVEPRWPPLSGSLVLWEVYIHHTGFSRDTQTSADDRALDVATSFLPHGAGIGTLSEHNPLSLCSSCAHYLCT